MKRKTCVQLTTNTRLSSATQQPLRAVFGSIPDTLSRGSGVSVAANLVSGREAQSIHGIPIGLSTPRTAGQFGRQDPSHSVTARLNC